MREETRFNAWVGKPVEELSEEVGKYRCYYDCESYSSTRNFIGFTVQKDGVYKLTGGVLPENLRSFIYELRSFERQGERRYKFSSSDDSKISVYNMNSCINCGGLPDMDENFVYFLESTSENINFIHTGACLQEFIDALQTATKEAEGEFLKEGL